DVDPTIKATRCHVGIREVPTDHWHDDGGVPTTTIRGHDMQVGLLTVCKLTPSDSYPRAEGS
ncbi:MAG: hypothetical protein ACYSW8_25380, partial [Planctomycetota bacterium]